MNKSNLNEIDTLLFCVNALCESTYYTKEEGDEYFSKFKDFFKEDGAILEDSTIMTYLLSSQKEMCKYLEYVLKEGLMDPNRTLKLTFYSVEMPPLFWALTPDTALILVLNGADIYKKYKTGTLIQANLIKDKKDPYKQMGSYLAKLHMKAYKIQKWYKKITSNKILCSLQ